MVGLAEFRSHLSFSLQGHVSALELSSNSVVHWPSVELTLECAMVFQTHLYGCSLNYTERRSLSIQVCFSEEPEICTDIYCLCLWIKEKNQVSTI